MTGGPPLSKAIEGSWEHRYRGPSPFCLLRLVAMLSKVGEYRCSKMTKPSINTIWRAAMLVFNWADHPGHFGEAWSLDSHVTRCFSTPKFIMEWPVGWSQGYVWTVSSDGKAAPPPPQYVPPHHHSCNKMDSFYTQKLERDTHSTCTLIRHYIIMTALLLKFTVTSWS